MKKVTKTLAIVGAVLAIGAALSAFVSQNAFAQTATTAGASSSGSIASGASATPFDAQACSAGGPFGAAAFTGFGLADCFS
jgi:hypothetical protein